MNWQRLNNYKVFRKIFTLRLTEDILVLSVYMKFCVNSSYGNCQNYFFDHRISGRKKQNVLHEALPQED
jgi:hypothetical protein